MKRSVSLFFSLIFFVSIWAQRDFKLVENRNFWLTSGNGASLTTFSVPSISQGEIFYEYSKGKLQEGLEGSHNNDFGADVRSFMRLNDKVVLFGSVTYENNYASNRAGSMLLPSDALKPFDLVEATDENAGGKRFEYFNIEGSAGWKLTKNLSVGAKVNFTAGSYAKFRDLRHTNTLMNLDTRVGAFWNFSGLNGVGLSLIYKRRTETIKFETFGTTDKVFKTLVDYANGYGEIETFGGEGFTDSDHETPLYDQYFGVGVSGGLANLYGEINYLHRTGYYGKKSQYTASYSQHSSDGFFWKVRYVLPKQDTYFCMIELYQYSEVLTSSRTNYRRETLPENSSVSYYEYYNPTKISDKARQTGALSFTGYWKPAGEIYLWHVAAELGYLWGKQTAYIFPYYFTEHIKAIIPEVRGSRSFLFENKSLLTAEIHYGMQFKYMEQLWMGANLKYEIALKKTSVRPSIKLGYQYQGGTGGEIKGLRRNGLIAELGIQF